MAYLIVPIEERELLLGHCTKVDTEEDAVKTANKTLKTLLIERGYSSEEVEEAYEIWAEDPCETNEYSFTPNIYLSAWSNWGSNALDVHIVKVP